MKVAGILVLARRMVMMLGLGFVTAAGGAGMAGDVLAAGLDPAQGRALLTVTGLIGHSNTTVDGAPAAVLDRAQLEGLGQITISTTSDYTDGVTAFTGPLARDVMALVGARGMVVKAVAANDYMTEIPLSDFENYDVVLAMSANGTRLRLRDKGPIWVVYPRDQHPELADPSFNTRWIWQLVKIDIR